MKTNKSKEAQFFIELRILAHDIEDGEFSDFTRERSFIQCQESSKRVVRGPKRTKAVHADTNPQWEEVFSLGTFLKGFRHTVQATLNSVVEGEDP